MKFTAVAAFIVMAALLSSTSDGLGINCRGSGNCGSTSCGQSNCLAKLFEMVSSQVPDDRHYSSGQQIACNQMAGVSEGECAFLQNTATGFSGGEIKAKFQDLVNHGCTHCGSVPMLPGNDVSFGELTVNYVSSACGNRVC